MRYFNIDIGAFLFETGELNDEETGILIRLWTKYLKEERSLTREEIDSATPHSSPQVVDGVLAKCFSFEQLGGRYRSRFCEAVIRTKRERTLLKQAERERTASKAPRSLLGNISFRGGNGEIRSTHSPFGKALVDACGGANAVRAA